MPSLAVFTRDLRIHDNPMLHAAGAGAVPVFISDPDIERRHGSPNRQAFLSEALIDLDRSLHHIGSRLVHRRGPWSSTVLDLIREVGADAVHVSRDVSSHARQRLVALNQAGSVPVVEHDGLTVVPPAAAATIAGTPYRVFTPYYRRWLTIDRRIAVTHPTDLADAPNIWSDPLPSADATGTSRQRERGGEQLALDRLRTWMGELARYEDIRDSPGIETSRLSAALHFGTISPLGVEEAAAEVEAESFIRQLAWRDFYHQGLFHNPAWAREEINPPRREWLDDEEGFEAWAMGATGYPLVDAGMRQLLATGWMHNRIRMVTASFLTKHLLIDWRRGARWFLTWLTDGDIANNQLNWQWVAGTGLDSNPHRMFNPTLQAQRHDPDGTYIRRWLPELADVPVSEVHDPTPLTRAVMEYPLPIIDHRDAVARFRSLRSAG